MKFGEKLKELRKAVGMSQRALAAHLNMEAAYLSRIESDYFNHLPARGTIERMVVALQLTQTQSDELHILAGKIPADIEHVLFADPLRMEYVREYLAPRRKK